MELFKSEEEKELWIRLNAERQIARDKSFTYFDTITQTYKPTLQALHPRSMEDAMDISRRQCDGDIEAGKLRFTLEELSTLHIEDLNKISTKHHQEWCRKFEQL